jgi:hypothetical protein
VEVHNSEVSLYQKVHAKRGRIAELAVGLAVNRLIDYAFDYGLYPFVIYVLGIWLGGCVMILLSFMACLITIWFYDWAERDWLGIEAVKTLKGYEGSNKLGRVGSWIMTRSEPVIFLFLCVQYDPFITMVYMRKGSYNGMNGRDWRVFVGSLLMGNGYWILACYSGISLVEWMLRIARPAF